MPGVTPCPAGHSWVSENVLGRRLVVYLFRGAIRRILVFLHFREVDADFGECKAPGGADSATETATNGRAVVALRCYVTLYARCHAMSICDKFGHTCAPQYLPPIG